MAHDSSEVGRSLPEVLLDTLNADKTGTHSVNVSKRLADRFHLIPFARGREADQRQEHFLQGIFTADCAVISDALISPGVP
jgi:hypothetical protein